MNTYLLVRRLAEHVTYGAIASKFCKNIRTAESWGREPESNSNPLGTGKKNPLDGVLRLIAMAYEKDKGLAKEMADLFPEYYEFLSGSGTAPKEPLQVLIGRAIKEKADFVTILLNEKDPDWDLVTKEIAEFEIEFIKLKNFVKEERRNLKVAA